MTFLIKAGRPWSHPILRTADYSCSQSDLSVVENYVRTLGARVLSWDEWLSCFLPATGGFLLTYPVPTFMADKFACTWEAVAGWTTVCGQKPNSRAGFCFRVVDANTPTIVGGKLSTTAAIATVKPDYAGLEAALRHPPFANNVYPGYEGLAEGTTDLRNIRDALNKYGCDMLHLNEVQDKTTEEILAIHPDAFFCGYSRLHRLESESRSIKWGIGMVWVCVPAGSGGERKLVASVTQQSKSRLSSHEAELARQMAVFFPGMKTKWSG